MDPLGEDCGGIICRLELLQKGFSDGQSDSHSARACAQLTEALKSPQRELVHTLLSEFYW